MFSCSQCSKEFTSQGSLARHVQNHSQTAKYVCNVCGVVFRRRDLLTRHMKLHDPGVAGGGSEADQGPATEETGARRGRLSEATGVVSRKRCHTACNRCRDLKIKCDGQFPCSRCSSSGKPCEFDRMSSRISHMAATSEERVLSGGSISTEAVASMSLPSFSPGVDEVAGDAGDAPVSQGEAQVEFGPGPLLPWDSAFSELTPWPWLHESIFLSGDPSSMFNGPVAPDFTITGDLFSELPLGVLHQQAHHAGGEENSSHPGANSNAAPVISTGLTAETALIDTRATRTSTPHPTAQAGGAGGPLSPPIDESSDAAPKRGDGVTLKQRTVDDVVTVAVQWGGSGDGGRHITPSELWTRSPSDLVTAFGFRAETGLTSNANTLEHFVKLYKEHFHQLWPLVPRRYLITGEMHPLLYLTLASIGAMYMERPGSECGTFLHNAVRRRVVLPVELDETDDNLVWLAQARLLLQVTALYFGQPRGFSYAQHLGTLLTAQARRMCLFSAVYHQQRVNQFKQMKGVATDTERLDLWLAIEERKRLAFGIFRGDTFTSVLLNTKPLITLEEIGLEFPSCNSVYNGEGLDPRLALEMVEHDRNPSQDLRASYVYHILLERDEMLPPLEPIAHETLLFGLHLLVWRFSYDRQLLEGLTGGHDFDADKNAESNDDSLPPFKKRRRDTFTSEVESLDKRSYQMTDLITERQRLAAALSKWERALPLAKTFARTEEDRSYVLSSLILYHLSLLRLYAPVEDIHQIHYRLADNRPVSTDLVTSIQAWAQSPKARMAVERVRSVWSLITQETQHRRARSRFNFNAYVGLHHGAAILWAYNGARDHATDRNSVSSRSHATGSSPTFSLHPDRTESNKILKTFVDLFHMISPARWSSFAEVADTLCTLEFPNST